MAIVRSEVYLAIVATIFSVTAVIVALADEGVSEKPSRFGAGFVMPPNCKKMILVVVKKQMKNIKACTSSMKEQYPDKQVFHDHFQCVIRCALAREDMLNERFKITNQSVQNFFDRHISTEFHEVGHVVVGTCMEQWGPKFDPDDEFCLAYGNFIKCLQEVVSDEC